MTSLTDSDLEFLNRFGFEPDKFATWQKQVQDGTLCTANNAVTGKLCAPALDQIDDLPETDDKLAELRELGEAEIRDGRFGVVILNGGMATRFGGEVKGVVDVLGGSGDRPRSFLELRIRDVVSQAERLGATIPVFLMNSFATDERTKEHLAEHDYFGCDPAHLHCFTQFISARMTTDGEVFRTEDGSISPHGPGHGDFSPAFRKSGALGEFLAQGGRTVFVANVDNLGARVEPTIIGAHLQSRAEATVEVAPKWPGDAGGSPYLYEGKLQLVEQIRYPDGFDPSVVDVFNTNTFHFDATALDRDFELGYYYVKKQVDGQDAVQVERLIGELTRFLRANFLRVTRTGKRSRFFPIKTREDLAGGRDEILAMYEGQLGD